MADVSNTLKFPRERSTRTGIRPLGFNLMNQGSCIKKKVQHRECNLANCQSYDAHLLDVSRYVDLFEADHLGQS